MRLKKTFYFIVSVLLIFLIGFFIVNTANKLNLFAKSNQGLSSESVFQAKFEEKIYAKH